MYINIFMKILFYSSIFKNIDLYINLGIVTITSFKKYNNFKLDWCIISDSNSNLEYIKSKLNFLQDNNLSLTYKLLPECIINYTHFNILNIAQTNSATELFIRRIKFVDTVKDDYDILVCVDFDILFRSNIFNIINDFYNSNKIIGGQTEMNPLYSNDIYRPKDKDLNDADFLPKIYVNFGFGMINTKFLPKSVWKDFLELSKNNERYFCSQEQSYFGIRFQNNIFNVDDLQLLIWNRLPGKELTEYYCKFKNHKLIHFSRPNLIYEDNPVILFDEGKNEAYTVMVLKFFDLYVNHLKNSKTDLWFKEKVLENYKKVNIFKKSNFKKVLNIFKKFYIFNI